MKPVVVSALALALGAAEARAEDPESPAPRRRAAALTAALVPGVLVHGTGHWMLGDKKTARRLRRMEMVGLLLAGLGGAAIGLSGTDENLAMFYVPMLVAGGTTFMGSFLTDVIGVATKGTRARGRARPPGWGGDDLAHTSLGYRHVLHPALDISHVARASAGFRARRVALTVSAEAEAAGRYQEQQVVFRYTTHLRPLRMASLDFGFDLTHRRLRDDRLSSYPGAVWAEMTWDLAKLAPSVPGAYGRGRFGVGAELVNYGDVPGIDDDVVPFVAAEAGLGFRLGRTDWELSYNHRKDGLPGGSFIGRLPGMLGSVGVSGRARVWKRWSLVGAARWGTGVTSWLGVEKGW